MCPRGSLEGASGFNHCACLSKSTHLSHGGQLRQLGVGLLEPLDGQLGLLRGLVCTAVMRARCLTGREAGKPSGRCGEAEPCNAFSVLPLLPCRGVELAA